MCPHPREQRAVTASTTGNAEPVLRTRCPSAWRQQQAAQGISRETVFAFCFVFIFNQGVGSSVPVLPRGEIHPSAVASGMGRPVRSTGAPGGEQEAACVQVVVRTNAGWTELRVCHVNEPDLAGHALCNKQSFADAPRVCAAPQL